MCAITGCSKTILDDWVGRILGIRFGHGVVGLDYMQTFAVFVGVKYIHEGADDHRTDCVVYYISQITIDHMFEHFNQGNTWPMPSNLYLEEKIPQPGMMVRAPRSVAGIRLKLDVLFEDFRYNLKKQFPS